MRRRFLAAVLCSLFGTLLAGPAFAGPIGFGLGHEDTFESGTTEGWVVGLLGAPHPAPPQNVLNGQGGPDDNFLLLTAMGGVGAGSRLAAINIGGAWAGDYTAAGITSIDVDFLNLGITDLTLRLLFEDPIAGPPTNVAVTSGFPLPAGGGWTHVSFGITEAELTALAGDVATLLSSTTALRIINSVNGVDIDRLVAQLGVDNITATASGPSTVPEPASLILLCGGLAAAALRRGMSRG